MAVHDAANGALPHSNLQAHSVMHPSIYGGQYMPPHHYGIGYGLSMHSGSDKDAGNKVVMSDTHPASESPAALVNDVGDKYQQNYPRCAAKKVEMSDAHHTLEGHATCVNGVGTTTDDVSSVPTIINGPKAHNEGYMRVPDVECTTEQRPAYVWDADPTTTPEHLKMHTTVVDGGLMLVVQLTDRSTGRPEPDVVSGVFSDERVPKDDAPVMRLFDNSQMRKSTGNNTILLIHHVEVVV